MKKLGIMTILAALLSFSAFAAESDEDYFGFDELLTEETADTVADKKIEDSSEADKQAPAEDATENENSPDTEDDPYGLGQLLKEAPIAVPAEENAQTESTEVPENTSDNIDELFDNDKQKPQQDLAADVIVNDEPAPQAKDTEADEPHQAGMLARRKARQLLEQKPTAIELDLQPNKKTQPSLKSSLRKTPEKNTAEIAKTETDETITGVDTDKEKNTADASDSPLAYTTDSDEKTSPSNADTATAQPQKENVYEIASSQPEVSEKNIEPQDAKAPFGLFWNASQKELQEKGFIFEKAEREDYDGVYRLINPQQENDTFALISAIFGRQDHLWCVYAVSKPIKDDAKASHVLTLYHKYYNALNKKYGNAHEFFTPNIYTETAEKEADETAEVKIKKSVIGGDNFLNELQEGSTSLYATFENASIGVTLGVEADKEGNSFISIDYKNLPLMKQEQDANLQSLIEDI